MNQAPFTILPSNSIFLKIGFSPEILVPLKKFLIAMQDSAGQTNSKIREYSVSCLVHSYTASGPQGDVEHLLQETNLQNLSVEIVKSIKLSFVSGDPRANQAVLKQIALDVGQNIANQTKQIQEAS